MEFSRLDEQQLDALREISNVGMGNAATALSQLTGKTVHLHVPRAAVLETAAMAGFLGGADRVVIGIWLRMLGNAQGNILMVFPRENAAKILETLIPGQAAVSDAPTELELSALKEVGNILASAYLNALGEMLRMTLIPSVPCLTIDTVGAITHHALADFGEVGETTLVLDTEFFSAGEKVNSEFFLLPAPSSLKTILAALGIGAP